MKISEKGLALIKKYEGLHLDAYTCPAGVLTIGYGHTKDVQPYMVITKDQADRFLLEDVASSEKAVNGKKLDLTQNQFDALVSFTFNCGSGNLTKLCKGRTVREIGDALLLYNKANGKVLKGLTNRRTEEQALFFLSDNFYPKYTGEYVNIDNIFKEIGAPYGNVTARKPVAIANGLTGYCGSRIHNMKMIELAKGGILKRG